MLPVRKRIEPDGRVSIGEMLKAANLRPDDLVEIVGDRNKIVIKPLAQKKAEGLVGSVAGKWRNRLDLIEDLLAVREDEDDRPGTTFE